MSKKRKIYSLALLMMLILCLFGFLGKSRSEAEEVPAPGIAASPKIFAHRGAVNQFNENTITSYKLAIGQKVDALEIDLRMTKDNVLIAMHDETIDRTTNGTGRVSELTLRDIKSSVTLGLYNGEVTMEEIPTLGEVFQTFGSNQKYYLETRLVYGETAMETVLVKMLTDHQLLDKEKVAIQSFSEESLEKMAELAPDLRLTFLFREGEFDVDKALDVDFPVIGMESSDATVEAVNALHSQGKEVHVFFNDPETLEEQQEKMKLLNIDGYFTDNISLTKRLLGK